jgi:hypothetical protein
MINNNVIPFPVRSREHERPQRPAIPPIFLVVLVAGYVALWLLLVWLLRW